MEASATEDEDSQGWAARALRQAAGLAQSHERSSSLCGHEAFALLPGVRAGLTELPIARGFVVGLLHQWLLERGHVGSAAQLLVDAQLTAPACATADGPGQLVSLLQAAAPANDAVFAVRPPPVAAEGAADDDTEVEVASELPGEGSEAGREQQQKEQQQTETGGGEEAPAFDLAQALLTVDEVCARLVQGGPECAELRAVTATTCSLWSSHSAVAHGLFRICRSAADEALREAAVRALVQQVISSTEASEQLVGLMGRFADELTSLGHSKHATELQQALLKGARKTRAMPKVFIWEDPQVPNNIFSRRLRLVDIPLIEVARQMTLFDRAIFDRITASEWLSLGWPDGEGSAFVEQNRAENICALVRRFQVLERWSIGWVLRGKTVEEKMSSLLFLVDLSLELLAIHSLHSALGLVGGIQSAFISPYKAALPQEKRAKLGALEQLTSYAYYRGWFKDQSSRACMPFVIPHLQSIALCSAAMPTFSDRGLTVNFSKCTALHRLVSELLKVSQQPFPFLPVQQIQSVVDTAALEKDSPSANELMALPLVFD